jgi:hypothetical protein
MFKIHTQSRQKNPGTAHNRLKLRIPFSPFCDVLINGQPQNTPLHATTMLSDDDEYWMIMYVRLEKYVSC